MMNAPVRFPFKAALCVSALLALSGCGDGGGGTAAPGNPTPSPTEPEIDAAGRYSGVLEEQGIALGGVQILLLDDGSLWAVYGPRSAGGEILVEGIFQGDTDVTATTITGKNLRAIVPGQSGALEMTASYASSPDTTNPDKLTGQLKIDGRTLDLDVARFRKEAYDFRTPASMPAVDGVWDLTSYVGPIRLKIMNLNGVGIVSAPEPTDCQVSGTLGPDLTKSFFKAKLNFGQDNCPLLLKGQALTGVAFITYSVPAGTRQLGMVLVDRSDENNVIGLPLAGTRSTP